MNSPFKEKALTWVVPIALACVLVALAVMQYRWSGEVSEAARTRMQASLQMSLMNVRQDLTRELAVMCVDMQNDGGSISENARNLSEKLQRWQRTASHPGLVASVYLWNSEDESASLLRLSPADGRFEAVAWPAHFSELHRFLSSEIEHEFSPQPRRILLPPAGEGAPSSRARQPAFPSPGAIDESIPALLFPSARSEAARREGRGLRSGWLLVELDSSVLRDRVFPDLVVRYFGEARSSEYEVAVVGGTQDKPLVLYSSDAGFGSEGAETGDGSLNLFGPPTPHTAVQPATYFFRPAGGAAAGVGEPPLISGGQTGDALSPIRFDPIHSGPDAQDWRVVVRSRQGSVEAAAEALRRRNLALSFGVLLVLAATMGLILFASQRARRLATLQMDFVAGVSHELRTPLAAILSAAENIADGVVENRQQLVRYGGLIKNHARQLNHLVEQVLRFAAVQRNKTSHYSLRPLHVSDAIEAALENTASAIRSSGVDVELDFEPDLPAVAGDPELLSQCLQNLITNAAKYSGESRWMALRAHRGEGSLGNEVIVTVEDHGIGISSEEMKQIFEPFYRSPAVAGSPIHGTGLGLALAKNFAEAMGGRLTVESEVGHGSSFSIHLPVATDEEPRDNAPIEVSANSDLPQPRA